MTVKDIKDNSPNEDLVGVLRELLNCAEKGELRTLFWVSGWNNDGVSEGWELDGRTSTNRFLGGLVRAGMDFVTVLNLSDARSASQRVVREILD